MKIIQHIIDFFNMLAVWMRDFKYLLRETIDKWRDEQ